MVATQCCVLEYWLARFGVGVAAKWLLGHWFKYYFSCLLWVFGFGVHQLCVFQGSLFDRLWGLNLLFMVYSFFFLVLLQLFDSHGFFGLTPVLIWLDCFTKLYAPKNDLNCQWALAHGFKIHWVHMQLTNKKEWNRPVRVCYCGLHT